MTRSLTTLLTLTVLMTVATAAQAANWVAGKHYSVIPQAQRTNVAPGKVEVMEVFSYGCPACNQFRPTMKKLKASLPANAQMVYLPASWQAAEAWPMFQRAYLTARRWAWPRRPTTRCSRQSGPRASSASPTRRTAVQDQAPTIDDAEKFYQRVTGVKPADFVNASKSFGVDLKMRQADSQITAMQVSGTPTLVVNGKYRVNNENLKTSDEIIELVKYLCARKCAGARGDPERLIMVLGGEVGNRIPHFPHPATS